MSESSESSEKEAPAATSSRPSTEPSTEILRLVVDQDAAGSRIDQFVARQVPALSRNQVQALIEAGQLILDGRPERKASAHLVAGSRIELPAPAPPSEPELIPNPDLPCPVLHEDEDLLVVDKPAGLVVHPAVGHDQDTLVNALVAAFPDLLAAFPDSRRPGIVHRLDRDTSGLILVARKAEAAASLEAQFKARSVEKTYLSLVRGIPSPAEGIVDAPIGRDPMQRQRMAALAEGKPARTTYRVLASAHGYSLVEARPHSGRTHQIRVHLAALGHPVAGDRVYGKRDRRIARQALHAWRLSFEHPGSGVFQTFESPLPEDFTRALTELGIALPD